MVEERNAGGEKSGVVEVANTSTAAFQAYLASRLDGTRLAPHIPLFLKNYPGLVAKVSADPINIDRANMPVIDKHHIALLRHDLKHGCFSINPPYDKRLTELLGTAGGPPIPSRQQLVASPEVAAAWEKSGRRHHDRVEASNKTIKAQAIQPIQKQIYLDLVLDKFISLSDLDSIKAYLKGTTLITSSGYEIIDGDHRWASSMLIDQNLELNCLVIDLPLNTLLRVSLAFTQLIGNKANC
jgi:hypothetical protein